MKKFDMKLTFMHGDVTAHRAMIGLQARAEQNQSDLKLEFFTEIDGLGCVLRGCTPDFTAAIALLMIKEYHGLINLEVQIHKG